MRICIISPDLTGAAGVRSVVEFLYQELGRAGHEVGLVTLATSRRDSESVRLLSPVTWSRGIGVEQRRVGDISHLHVGAATVELEWCRYLPRGAIRKAAEAYDLIQVVGGSPCWSLVARGVGKPVALQVATTVYKDRSPKLEQARGLDRLVRSVITAGVSIQERRALRYVDVAFVENHWMEKWLREHSFMGRIVFAPPGIDTDVFTPAPLAAQQSTPPYILSVGRLDDPRKNVRLAVQAMAWLSRSLGSDTPELVLAGRRRPSDEDMEEAARLGVADKVRIVEAPSRAELAFLYRGALCFLSTSYEEGLGIAILEAMASGIPVVATDSGGSRVSVRHGETGVIVRSFDPVLIGTWLHRLVREPVLRQKWGNQARTRCLDRFSATAACRRFTAEYERLVLERPTG